MDEARRIPAGSRGRADPRGALHQRFVDEVAGLALPDPPFVPTTVEQHDVSRLPEPVRRYLAFMDVAGRPRVTSFRARFVGRFRLRKGLGWMPAEAWQYNTVDPVTRVFVMRIRAAGLVPMIGRDVYADGRGRMEGRLLDRWTIVRGTGEAFDIGELTTFLNDAVLLAPSMLLGGAVRWEGVDDDAFDVSLTDAGRTVTARVLLRADGAPVDFRSRDRFVQEGRELRPAEWRTPVARWERVHGRPVPTSAEARWMLPKGPFPYVRGGFDPASLLYDVGPALV